MVKVPFADFKPLHTKLEPDFLEKFQELFLVHFELIYYLHLPLFI